MPPPTTYFKNRCHWNAYIPLRRSSSVCTFPRWNIYCPVQVMKSASSHFKRSWSKLNRLPSFYSVITLRSPMDVDSSTKRCYRSHRLINDQNRAHKFPTARISSLVSSMCKTDGLVISPHLNGMHWRELKPQGYKRTLRGTPIFHLQKVLLKCVA